ncbi:nitroreductase/quinone reductase family protein [Actinotalea sp. M2MS4P-6]|uniref:nitroreductase/quinone reductase family protein n=1 Tax=Actinotalea sp. M2MS4P-6 TaxID=2983762 RepID=UPI0021E37C18|nr:nitroreductase/quinone reductase family protein [Actinotalea sp. M2MS4P-6]MCV2395694.1 nitroreductase/quinone reductase family protein [Actinotalea sp. M2MS4P-6]
MGVIISDAALRRMYTGQRADRTATRLSRLWARVFAWGLQPRRWVTLEVPGRTTGRPTTFPLGMADLDGRWYLVSMLGERCNWVRNVRAAGGRAVLVRRRRRPVTLREVPVPLRARILRRSRQPGRGGRPHIPVDPAAPLADFEAVAAQYPVFEVLPAED